MPAHVQSSAVSLIYQLHSDTPLYSQDFADVKSSVYV